MVGDFAAYHFAAHYFAAHHFAAHHHEMNRVSLSLYATGFAIAEANHGGVSAP